MRQQGEEKADLPGWKMSRRSFLATCATVAGTASLMPESARAEEAHRPDGICVLDGPGVHHLRHGLERVSCAFRSITGLNAETLSQCRVLILAGSKPPVGARRAKVIREFLDAGGAVLGVGGGATCMIDLGLFDAKGYYPSGTTIHQSTFDGYHRLTFGYPGAKPEADWPQGVPMLVRATEGPLMELGPQATSVLTYGRPYSAAAFQPIGKGIVLLIGPDPQGGDVYHEVDRSKVTTGAELKTDRLLANAIAFLQDRTCNLLPNAGFEEHTELSAERSNWQVALREGAETEWCRGGAPEGAVYLKLTCPSETSRATLQPYCPLVVERGSEYRFRCQYRSSVGWEIAFTALQGNSLERPGTRVAGGEEATEVSVPPSSDWSRAEATFAVPEDVSYVKLTLSFSGKGELAVDNLALQKAE
jgi:hypothetical protein